ncbi:MAG: MoxR family ATPase [Rhodocyclaceae bacterium]|jgi:MoxR-like ATPase|nr:MoxR family ATPase [Rhodocyclaceae bacterium]
MPLRQVNTLLSQAGSILLGKEPEIRLAVACLLARGHLLIEDVPGVGKTTLAHLLAHLLGLPLQRIQFTSDLLPADVLGVSVFDRQTQRFEFHPGPVFSPFLLADEINRATPKTQSALLEAMEERQVTVDGTTHRLPAPFFVIATQNPSQQIGTFPLPESQLDRFLMRIHLGFPDRAAERALLLGEDRRTLLARMAPALVPGALTELQTRVRGLHVSPRLVDYLQSLLEASRDGAFLAGLSPRAGLALLGAARAWAFLEGRDLVLPEDVQAVFGSVAGHRLRLAPGGQPATPGALQVLLEGVAVP